MQRITAGPSQIVPDDLVGLQILTKTAAVACIMRIGKTLMIEVNDGYALGGYGLFYLDYAKLLSAWWAELTHTTDECAFDTFSL